jgi:amino acid adenylation domain-containing protein
LDKGEPKQVIAPPSSAGVPLPVVDLRGFPEIGREKEAHRLAESEAVKPFDLERGPLLRAGLWRTSESDHWFTVVLHHSVMDGWSFHILLEELCACYAAFADERSPALPELSIQYADVAGWQYERLQIQSHRPDIDFWKQQLRDAPAFLDLPTDYPRGPIQSMRGSRVTASLGPEQLARLRAFNRQEGVTLFMTMLAAFQTLLHRHSGQTDLVVGAPFSNRCHPEMELLIGMFVNLLVFRADLSGNPTFRQFLQRTREAALGALSHKDAPFAAVIEALQLPRDPARTPLFQAAFNLLSYPEQKARLFGLQVTKVSPPGVGTKFDLQLFARDKTDKLKLALIYNADLFSEASMTSLLGQYVTLISEILTHPDRRLSELPVLHQTERAQKLVEASQAMPANSFLRFEPRDIEQSIAARFEQQAALHADRLAIVTRRHSWTYAQLNQLANQVAQALLNKLGPGPHRVALLFEHDAVMVAAMLGTLKAGMAYVPLDPSNPDERLGRILGDAEPSILITSRKNEDRKSGLPMGSLPHLVIDEVDSSGSTPNPGLSVRPDSIAYLLYTSGSTGQPKAVVQSQRNVLHFIRVYTNNLHIAPDDRMTLFANYCFDAAVMDIFGALLNGATLFPRSVGENTPGEVLEFLRKERITIYHSTPTVYRHLLASLSPGEKLAAVRLVILGGEEVVHRDIELHREHFSEGCILVNGFGPTEATVAAEYFISQHTPVRFGRVPIGLPVEGMEVLLLDETGVENGISGEIGLRSEHVALEYWRQPELTKAKFLPDPTGGPARIFRTGDYGRRRPDGTLEFVERRDFQVKVRGFRIELGEVEAALRRLAGVREAVVRKHADLPSDRPLAAYVKLTPEATCSPNDLRDHLRGCLPEYMVPSVVMVLDELPLLSNGKLNHRALPSPASCPQVSTGPADNPRNLLELKLSHIWQCLFDRPSIGRQENFFDLGGHSLLAVRLREEVARLLGVDLPIATLFQSPTIESLVRRLTEADWSPSWSSLVPLQPLGTKSPLFFTHGWGGDVFAFVGLSQLLSPDGNSCPSRPVYGLQAVGLDGKEMRHTSVEQMAEFYVGEVRSFRPEGPYHLAGYSLGGLIAYEIAQQLRRAGHEVALLALLDAPQYLLPWRLFVRTHFPELAWVFRRPGPRLRRWWNMRQQDRSKRLRAHWFALKSRFAKNISKTPVTTPVLKTTEAPQLVGYEDYYQALASAYRVRPYPGSVNLFISRETNTETVAAWKGLARGGLVLHHIPAEHHEMVAPRHLPLLARELKAALDRSDELRLRTGANSN